MVSVVLDVEVIGISHGICGSIGDIASIIPVVMYCLYINVKNDK